MFRWSPGLPQSAAPVDRCDCCVAQPRHARRHAVGCGREPVSVRRVAVEDRARGKVGLVTTFDEQPNGRTVERFEWLEPAHTLGETELAIESDALRQALAWQVAAELVRRHPKQLRLLGEYTRYGPSLTPMEMRPDGHSWRALHFIVWAKGTHITPLADWTHGRFNWLDVLLAPNLRTYVVHELERLSGLIPPATTPPTMEETIGIRFIAAFMAKTALAPAMRWTAVNGMIVEDDGSYPFEELFAAMPAVHADWAARDSGNDWSTMRYWFLLPHEGELYESPSHAPVAAVDFVSGALWTPDGHRRALMAEYTKHGRQVDALVSRYLPPTQ